MKEREEWYTRSIYRLSMNLTVNVSQLNRLINQYRPKVIETNISSYMKVI